MKLPSLQSILLRIEPIVTSPRVSRYAVGLAILFTLPSLWNGFQSDDLTHRVVLLQKEGSMPFPTDSRLGLFAFVPENPERTMKFVDLGIFPWWTHPDLRLALFRPLTALTHILDYALWPNSPFLMHVQNLAWYAFLVAVVAMLYRRWLGVGSVAGLAAFLYALDDAHGFGAGWIANRNAVICASLGLAALLFHDRWRSERRPVFGVTAVCFYAAALLGGEGGVAASAYLFSYALFLDNPRRNEVATLLKRLASLLPYVIVGLVYVINYKLGGHGTKLSGVYIDPASDPLRFLSLLARNAPVLLLGQIAMPPSELAAVLAPWGRTLYAVLAVLAIAVIALIARPVFAKAAQGDSLRAASLKFFALGTLLSLPPICATFPSNRLLFFVGFGAMGLIAQFLVGASDGAWRRPVSVLAFLLFVVHAVLGPLGLPVSAMALGGPMKIINRGIASFPFDEPNLAEKHVVFISNPIPLYSSMIALDGILNDRPMPLSIRTLSSAVSDVEVERLDDRTLRVRPADAFNPGIDRNRPSGVEPPLDLKRIFVMLDSLFRDPEIPFHVGETISLTGMTIEIAKINSRGLATEVLFRFEVPLEDDSLLWLEWENWIFRRSAPPKLGERVILQGK